MKILLKYESKPTRFFGDSWEFPYELTIQSALFFGLYKSVYKINYTVSMFQDIKSHKEHWDNLILTKKPLTHA